jgi:Ca-activated chloride channel family protein
MPTQLLTIPESELQRYRLPDGEASFGSLATSSGHLPLRALALEGRITGLHFTLRLRQTFLNTYASRLEATYIFPLPARAAVTSFVMRTSTRELIGELKERGEAREAYDQAIARGQQAAIAEEERAEVFTMRVGNIPAGERVEVELTLSGPLSMADELATFRFPLVVAPRYIPGRPLGGEDVGDGVAPDTDATPDASRISPPVLLPGYPNPVRLDIVMTVDPAGLELGAIHSSLPELRMHSQSDGTIDIRLDPTTGKVNADLILRFEVLGKSLQSTVTAVTDADGRNWTWNLCVVPPATLENPAKRHVVVLLDRSGSMAGWKMVAARRAVGRIVDTLNDGDTFAVLAFDDHLEWLLENGLRPSLQATDRNRFTAVQALSKVEARGGTEILPALRAGLKALATNQDSGQRMLVLVTDGQVGNEDQVLGEVQRLAGSARVFTVGIDRAVNASLLERLASSTGGHCQLVESEERLDEVMVGLRRRLCHPILTGLTLQGIATSELSEPATDLYPSLPAQLYGRSSQALPETVTVTGRTAEGQHWEQRVPVIQTNDATTHHLWARQVLLTLEQHFVADGSVSPGAITEFSLKHQVLSRFTAFVAVDRVEGSVAGPLIKKMQAVDLPVGSNAPAPMRRFRSPDPAASASFAGSADPFACSADPFNASPGVASYADPFGLSSNGASFDHPFVSAAQPVTLSSPLPASKPMAALPRPAKGKSKDLLTCLQALAKPGLKQTEVAELLEQALELLQASGQIAREGLDLLRRYRLGETGLSLALQQWIERVSLELGLDVSPRRGWWKLR